MATLKPPENPKEIVTQFGPKAQPNAFKDKDNYRYLKLEWIEVDEKWEYILRYNSSRNGFWLSSAPHKRNYYYLNEENIFENCVFFFCLFHENLTASHYSDQPSFGAFSGTIQVIIYNENYLVLTFCENVPQQQLFSIMLTRHSNSLSMDVCYCFIIIYLFYLFFSLFFILNFKSNFLYSIIFWQIIKTLRDKLRAKDLPNIFYRRACSGVNAMTSSMILAVTAALMFTIQTKWPILK